MASPLVDLLISVGNTLLIDKRVIAGINALWFYDYFLTLRDEIEFAWSGSISFVFVLFVLNRYWPLVYLLWFFVAYWSPSFTKTVCDKSAWLIMLHFTFTSLFAQGVITLRIYAVTRNNRWIASYLSFITLVHFVFGMYLSVFFALRPAAAVPDIPVDEFQFCLFQRWRTGELVYTVLSIVYDTSAFLIVIYSTKYRNHLRIIGVPRLIDQVVEGATVYFLMIFTGHILVVFFEFLAPETVQLLPASVVTVLMPLMITRLILSLKKAASSPVWSSGGTAQPESAIYARHTIGGSGRGGSDIALRRLPEEERSGFSLGP